MKKFFLMTRGRTGSTAVIDGLNSTRSVVAAQELFLRYDVRKKQKLRDKFYSLIPPFDIWQERGTWIRYLHGKLFGKSHVKSYLRETEVAALRAGKLAFGFKVLSQHFDETAFLREVLQERGYLAVYLTRNIPRQVISGMVARLRGKYNARAKDDYEDNARYVIDIEEFESLVKWETQAVKNDLAMLEKEGFKFIEVSYEEFMADRRSFFERIANFLAVPTEMPAESSYSVMIRNLEHTVENYQAVADCAAAMGMSVE